jgi:DNA ligase (NAD+)
MQARMEKMKILGMPFVCSSCGSALVWKSVDLACTNPHCGDKNVKEVASFLIKCGVENVTDTSLSNWGIGTYKDLFTFKGDGSASQNKMLVSMRDNVFSKQKEELFGCMNFDGAGRDTIDKLIEFYGKGDLETATRGLYTHNTKLDGLLVTGYPESIGQKTIDKIEVDWKKNLRVLIHIMKDQRYNPKAKVAKAVGVFTGKTFLLTGALTEKRAVVEKQITDAGGTIASSVSKTLSFLVCGPDSWGSSSKYIKAEKLASQGVKIITEDQLKGMM